MTKCIILFMFIPSLLLGGKVHPEAKLYFTDYCDHFHYPSEKHQVNTKDGYILTIFRIQAKYTQIKQGLQPIILNHGLLDCSDTFIINDEDKALGFVLANRGYDVWLSNNRGNKHSKAHIEYSPDQKIFWDFSFEEMAIYDLPATFKYVSEQTGRNDINYIGHSQGTTQFHIHLTMFPKKEDSIVRQNLKTYIGLGPVAYANHQDSQLMNLLLHSDLDKLLHTLGIEEFMPGDTWLTTDVGRIFCAYFPVVCGDLVGAIVSADKNLDNYNRYDVLSGHDPAGTSSKNILHWKQSVLSGKFQRYDYGDVLNRRIYGQAIPPDYDLNNIDIPVHYFAGYQDLLADPTDVKALAAALVNSPKVWLKFFDAGHCSFMWGREVPFYSDLFDILEGRQ